MSELNRRVVVTGLGLVTPLGTGVEKNWEAIVAGRSGIGPITRFPNVEFMAARIAGEVLDFRAEDFIEPKEIKKMDLFIQYSVAAADMAVRSSGFTIDPDLAPRVAVIIGVGLGGIATIENYQQAYMEGGPRKISPFFIPKVISNWPQVRSPSDMAQKVLTGHPHPPVHQGTTPLERPIT